MSHIILILLLQIQLSNAKSLRKLVSGNTLLIILMVSLSILIIAGIIVVVIYCKKRKQKEENKVPTIDRSNCATNNIENFSQETMNSLPYSNNRLRNNLEISYKSQSNNSEILKNRITKSFIKENKDIDSLRGSKMSTVQIKNLD